MQGGVAGLPSTASEVQGNKAGRMQDGQKGRDRGEDGGVELKRRQSLYRTEAWDWNGSYQEWFGLEWDLASQTVRYSANNGNRDIVAKSFGHMTSCFTTGLLSN